MGACPSGTSSVAQRPPPVSRIAKKNLVTGCIIKNAGTGEGCCALPRQITQSAASPKLLTSVLGGVDAHVPLRVCIIGGGPVGLCLALRLAEFPGRPVSVTVYDRRWFKETNDGKFYWADNQPGQKGRWVPRDQIVTVRDEVVDLFKDGSQATHALFDGEKVWPGSRNISISPLEVKLLARVQEADVSKSISLRTVPFEIAKILDAKEPPQIPDTALARYRNWIEAEVLVGAEMPVMGSDNEQGGIIVAADGADSLTLKAFACDFEWIPAASENWQDVATARGNAGVDYLLGVGIEDPIEANEASSRQHRLLSAALSASQCRYLYNPDSTTGRGYLNIRLHRNEFAALSQAIGPHSFRPGSDRPYWDNQLDKIPCRYSCGEARSHGGQTEEGAIERLFKRLPWLEMIVREGAAMFGIKDHQLHKRVRSIVASCNAPGSAKSYYCAQPIGGMKVCLLGDVAMTHHWFPGRGLEAGLKAADALCRVLHKGAPLSAYEAFMKRLQHREIRVRSQVMLSQDYAVPDCSAEVGGEESRDLAEAARFAERVKVWKDRLQGPADAEAPEQNLPLADEEIDKVVAAGLPRSLPVGADGWAPEMVLGPINDEVMPTRGFISAVNGWADMSAGRLDKAVDAFEQALENVPGDSLSAAMLAAVKLHMDRYEEVVQEDFVISEGGVGALHHSIIAEAKVHLGRFKEAVEDCDKALQCEPGNPLAYTVRGEANLRLGNYMEAAEDCDAAVACGTVLAYSVRAQAKLHLNRCEEAVMDCDCALSQGMYVPSVLAIRGDANRRLGKFQIAILDCDKALQLNPNFSNALSVRGEAYLDIGDLSNAAVDLDKAISTGRATESVASSGEAPFTSHDISFRQTSPSISVSTLNARSDVLVRLGRFDEAIASCDEALQMDERSSLGYAIRAEAKLRSYDYEGCIQDCTSALKLQPHDAFTYVVRAESNLCLDRIIDCYRDCDQAIGLSPDLEYGNVIREEAIKKDKARRSLRCPGSGS